MGQYFLIVNLDKKEYIRPRLLKLWEICANNDCRVLPYLLATNNPDGAYVPSGWKWYGHWCGDRIAVVGDYADQAANYDGPLWNEILKTFKDITKEVVEEFNTFIQVDSLKIRL